MQYKVKKIVNTIKEDLQFNESDDESDEWIIRLFFKKRFMDSTELHSTVFAVFSYALLSATQLNS